jgi:Ran GTPase-activating protein (RanGAP) involved in mRNA processing and transport
MQRRNVAIGNEGGKCLAKALENNRSITHIDLYHNCIENDGIKSFASMLTINSTIKSINLCANWSTNEGAKSMISMMENNLTLIFVDFNGKNNSIDKYLER